MITNSGVPSFVHRVKRHQTKVTRSMKTISKLSVIAKPHPDASILSITPGTGPLPFPPGPDDVDLSCGSCGLILIQGMSPQTCAKMLAAPYQLLVKCSTKNCLAYNVIPATITGPLSGDAVDDKKAAGKK